MFFFEFLIDWKSSNTFLKAFLQPGKTTEIHRPAAQSEDTKNFVLQTSSRPGAVNYPFSGNNPAQHKSPIKDKLISNVSLSLYALV